HLDLSGNGPDSGVDGITSVGIQALVASPLWQRLEELNLGALHFRNPQDIQLIANALPASRISRLGLAGAGSQVGEEALVKALEGAPSWGHVRELNLNWNQLQAGHVRRLCRCPGMSALTRLDAFASVDDEGVQALADCPASRSLTSLGL